MQLTLIKNDDPLRAAQYKLARVVYAETGAVSLRDVEALASMIGNLHAATGRDWMDIASDGELFESLNPDSVRHHLLKTDAHATPFVLCLRVVGRMMRGNLPDCAYGAVRFHRTELLPDWAVNRGYILETDVLTFYL